VAGDCSFHYRSLHERATARSHEDASGFARRSNACRRDTSSQSASCRRRQLPRTQVIHSQRQSYPQRAT